MIPAQLQKEAEAAAEVNADDICPGSFMCGVRWLFTRLCEMSEGFDRKAEADEVLCDYIKPSSYVDMGNLYFAATEYRNAYLANQAALLKAREMLERVESERDLHIQVATGQAQTISEMRAGCERMERVLRKIADDTGTGSIANVLKKFARQALSGAE